MCKSINKNHLHSDKTKFRQKSKKCDVKFYHVLTWPFRVLPNFIIIGAQRSGTTSLYRYLMQNPCMTCMIGSRRKEVHYFDFKYEKGINWYKGHFPTILRNLLNRIRNCPFLTGEATPSYLLHPHALKRMFDTIPGVKLILLLRNPVDRAYSHYHTAVLNGVEHLSFSEAIRSEDSWIADEYRKICEDEKYYSFDYHRRSFLTRGIYINQIKNWLKYFPRDQLMIIKSEDFFFTPGYPESDM